MRRPLAEGLYHLRSALLRATTPALTRYRRRYHNVPTVRFEPMPEAQPRPLEGYLDRLAYREGETATFHLRSPYEANTLVVERVAGPDRFEEAARVPFGRTEQSHSAEASERGCAWTPTRSLPLDERFETGYYRARIEAAEASTEESEGSAISFIVSPARTRHRIAVLAPVSTWVAYNPWGEQSLYHNEQSRENVYLVSTNRPNPALGWAPVENIHAMPVEAQAFNWLNGEMGADLYPDVALEDPAVLAPYSMIVLAYHMEYVSPAMMSGLRQLVQRNRSLLALGGNQLYWRIHWLAGRAGLECHKDATPFADGTLGGLWRHTAMPEDRLLGVRFTAPGTGTYAPYRVTNPRHWLYEGLNVTEGQLFGETGITPLPICGDETDQPTPLSRLRTDVVARGLNRPDAVDGEYTVYDPSDPAWDGSAGGTIAFTPHSKQHAVLATGAIHSASGLGADPIFSGLVRNFLRRYLT